MKVSVFAIFGDTSSVEPVVNELVLGRFLISTISVLVPETPHIMNLDQVQAEGGFVGLSGMLIRLDSVKIPGAGAFLAAGPIRTLLTGVAGAPARGIRGTLLGLGFPKNEALVFGRRLEEGCMLIAVQTENSEKIKAAREIFERANASDIGLTDEYPINLEFSQPLHSRK
jgi:hypothetical protein